METNDIIIRDATCSCAHTFDVIYDQNLYLLIIIIVNYN